MRVCEYVCMYVPLCAAYSDVESHFSYWFKNNGGQEVGHTNLYTYIDCDGDMMKLDLLTVSNEI